MRRVRVLVAEMPRMLADIVRAVVDSQTDFELAGEGVDTAGLVDTADLVRAAGDRDVDVLVLGGPLLRAKALRLLCQSPRMKIVTIDPDGRGGALHEFRVCRSVLHEISPISLVDAIRGDAGGDETHHCVIPEGDAAVPREPGA